MVFQSPGANATEVNARINKLYEDLKPTMPAGLEFVKLESSDDFLYAAIDNVVETLIIYAGMHQGMYLQFLAALGLEGVGLKRPWGHGQAGLFPCQYAAGQVHALVTGKGQTDGGLVGTTATAAVHGHGLVCRHGRLYLIHEVALLHVYVNGAYYVVHGKLLRGAHVYCHYVRLRGKFGKLLGTGILKILLCTGRGQSYGRQQTDR